MFWIVYVPGLLMPGFFQLRLRIVISALGGRLLDGKPVRCARAA